MTSVRSLASAVAAKKPSITDNATPLRRLCAIRSPQRSATTWSIGRMRCANRAGRSWASQAASAARRRPSSSRAMPRRSSAIEAALMNARSSSTVSSHAKTFGGRRRPLNLRQHVGVEEQVHGISSRGSSCTRSSSRSAPRSGEASRNSASVPLRAVFRAHSSGGNDHRIGPAVSGDDLRASLGTIDHLGQAGLGIGERPRVSRRRIWGGAVVCHAEYN